MTGAIRAGSRLRRYRDIAVILGRYARPDALDGDGDGSGPEAFAADLERLGPTFIKLGQLLSTRPDLLPERYLEALARLQDDVKPFPFEDARRIIESDLHVRLHKAFPVMDERPAAAASLAQIHRAVLRDGTEVAVKVQRPRIRELVDEDMAALGRAALFLEKRTDAGRRYELARVFEELRKDMERELDFLQEADHLRTLADNLEEFDLLTVPAPHDDFSSARVLTMDYVTGRKITALTALRLNEVDGPALADQLFRAYLKQILVDGFFHADPHPGNMILDEEGRLAILDLGMVGIVGPGLQEELLSLLLAISEGRAESAATVAVGLGRPREDFDEPEFRSRVESLVLANKDASISELNMGRIIFDIARASAACGLRLPSEMTMIAKALLSLEDIVAGLDPEFEPAAAIRDESSRLLSRILKRDVSRASMTSGLLEAQKFAARLPDRLGKVLDVIGGNELRLKVDAVDEHLLIQGMQKIANRIALGLVLASLIIGAALLMQVRTRFTLFDYPGLAILLFLSAAGAGIVLMLDILYYDDKRRTRLRK